MIPSEELAIAELVYWFPAGAVSFYCVFKHGFSRQMGWYSLMMLALFRIIGSICSIISVYHPGAGVIEASFICSSIGLVCLIGALAGVTLRVNMNMHAHSIVTPRIAKIVQTPNLASLILSILAGIKIGDGTSADVKTGITYFKISIGIVTGVYIVTAILAIITFKHRAFVLESERLFVKITLISIPFITIRLIDSWLASWMPITGYFFMLNQDRTSMIIKGVLGAAPEIIVASMYFYAGILVDNKSAPTHSALKAAARINMREYAQAKLVQVHVTSHPAEDV